MKDKILVTGINGFVGKHMAKALSASGFEVVGLIREKNIDFQIKDLVSSFEICDLSEAQQVAKIDLSSYRSIINLAGLANVAQSFAQPDFYMRVNVAVLTNLLQRVLDQNLNIRVLAISTGAVYDSIQEMPLDEGSRLIENGSPYVQSKIAMEKEAEKFRQKGLDVVVARPFNHIGPGQMPGFLIPDLIQQVRKSLLENKPIKVGNLKTKRDYTDVRDVVKAYIALATKELEFDIYNVCSGRSIAGEELLRMIINQLAPAMKPVVEIDNNLFRPNDPQEIYGSFNRLKNDTGWQPSRPIAETIKDAVSVSG